MFKNLIVPLDGSRLSESILPMAVFFAQKLQASVTLVHVIEKNAPDVIHGETHLSHPEQAEEYLEDVHRRMFPPGIRVEKHVHRTAITDVAGSIVEHAQEFESDLVMMCTHGRGGFRKLLYGSIAQQVVAFGITPVLLVRPTEGGNAAFLSGRPFLAPLDGTPMREQAVPVAAGLAAACGAELRLLMVVPTMATLSGVDTATRILLPATTEEILGFAHEDAEHYMRDLVSRHQLPNSKITADIRRGDPADMILAEAHKIGVDLIVLTTTGKAGMEAFWSSSLAHKISNRTHLALLLIPARK